jgi:hypothetical protein
MTALRMLAIRARLAGSESGLVLFDSMSITVCGYLACRSASRLTADRQLKDPELMSTDSFRHHSLLPHVQPARTTEIRRSLSLTTVI